MAWVPMHVEGLPPGLSGWSSDHRGILWTIPERTPTLVPLRVSRRAVSSAGANLRIEGLRDGEETEAIAALSADRFVLGTESSGVRASDSLLWLRREGTTARVVRRVAVPYALWQIEAEDNRGIEGVCTAGGQVLVAVEPVKAHGGRRLGLLARYADGRFQAIRFPLTSATGKLSGIDCRIVAGRIEVIAIERHYEVSRLLRLSLPLEPAAAPLTLQAALVRDLRPTIEDPPNLEGIVWRDDGYWLISDNHHGGVTGPTRVLWVAHEEP